MMKHIQKCNLLMILVICALMGQPCVAASGLSEFQLPTTPRATYNFNPGWKFAFGDANGAEQPQFDDSVWASVSLPHTWNETDTYRAYTSHSSGDQGEKMFGIGWYRKHFMLPVAAKDGKVFLEFEGLKQAARFFVNGQSAGKFENGVTACGLDITDMVTFGDTENVLAVKVDNSNDYKEEATGIGYEWMGRAFNPNFGGLNRNVRLHLTGKIYQTLPLYENLETTGVYIYPKNFDLAKKTVDIHVESEVINETADYASITLSTVVVDKDGVVCAKLDGNTSDLVAGQSEVFTAEGTMTNARFWDVNDPYLYHVYSMLSVDDKVIDVIDTQTGFRKTEFKGGAGTGGVYLNDKFIWLTGYAQRSVNDWPGLGQAYPDWMHDFNAQLVRASNANYIRWMHIAPQAVDVRSCDRFGIIQICPAGDKEKDPVLDTRNSPDVAKRQWEQRVEVMRSTIIYFRNSPSILFWEAGNNVVTAPHMTEMVALRKQWDPHGGRAMGTRHGDDSRTAATINNICEYYGIMIGQDRRTDRLSSPSDIFRGYSAERRDRAPLIETEDFRDEAGRNIWDDYSPPHFGFKPKNGMRGNRPIDTYHWNSETFCFAATMRYASYMRNRIDNTDPAHSKWSGYASIYFSDSDADGRQQGSYVLRVSGKVDGVRLPKSLFYVSRVMQSDKPDLHIIGHWNYPEGTTKTMYVAASHCDQVELFVNGKSLGVQTKPFQFVDTYGGRTRSSARLDPNENTGCIYAFPDVRFEPGVIKAIATKNGNIVAQQEIQTAGEPKAIKLTLHTGPLGLQADGSDVALIDFEVVDAQGRRCPTDEARIDFAVTGPVVWRGGLNAAKLDSTNNLYLDTECGINRVAIRSTTTPGMITVTATREGLPGTTLKVESKPVEIRGGLESGLPQTLPGL